MRLLDDVLDTLNYKNGQAQKVDGQISEFMHPDAKKAQKIIDDEREAIRKLNNSAVMPIEGIKSEVDAPVGLINLFEKYGYRDNKKCPPKKENKFYQALTGGQPEKKQKTPTNKQQPPSMRSK